MLTSRSLNSTLDRMLTLNRVLDEALAGTLDGSREGRAWAPALDLVERHDAYLIANGGSFYVVGGTSASAPAFAGLMLLGHWLHERKPQTVVQSRVTST